MLHALAGFVTGFTHVLSGPDHLAAIAPLAAASPRRGGRTGVLWGAGHSGGVAVVALLALALRGVLPIDALSSWSERVVGVVLIGVGLWGLRLALWNRVHVHVHDHDGARHVHVHAHRHPHAASAAARSPAAPHTHTHAAFGVGVLHGLAGSSHFLGVLPALALPALGAAVSYVVGFAAGTIAAMSLYGRCIGALAVRSALRPAGTYRLLLGSCAGIALVVGCIWLAV